MFYRAADAHEKLRSTGSVFLIHYRAPKFGSTLWFDGVFPHLDVLDLGVEAAVVGVFDEVIDVDPSEEYLDRQIDVGAGWEPDLVVDQFVFEAERGSAFGFGDEVAGAFGERGVEADDLFGGEV